jgi:hypothetical protein
MKNGHLRDKFWRIASKGVPDRSRPIAVIAVAHDRYLPEGQPGANRGKTRTQTQGLIASLTIFART